MPCASLKLEMLCRHLWQKKKITIFISIKICHLLSLYCHINSTFIFPSFLNITVLYPTFPAAPHPPPTPRVQDQSPSVAVAPFFHFQSIIPFPFPPTSSALSLNPSHLTILHLSALTGSQGEEKMWAGGGQCQF